MASIRRTLSPYNDRSHSSNGLNDPFSPSSMKHHPLFNGGSSSSSRTTLSPVRRFLTAFFLQKHSSRNKSHHFSWKKPLLRCFLFFFLGFLLGTAPFNNTDLRITDFSFETRHPAPVVNNVNHHQQTTNSVGDVAVVVRSKDTTDIVLNTVELAVVQNQKVVPRKQLLVVTPTYNRALQAYYLNRLGQVLRLVKPPVVWIVVEMNGASVETAEMLRNMGVMYRHLVCARNSTDVKDRGVHQRNTALEHIERHRLDGIVYFADDDNVYSRDLFESLRDISRFGTWPVAMLAQSKNKAILEGPVCNGSQVIGWHTNEKSKRLRRFHVDMSGFAFNSTILWEPKKWHRPTSDPIRQLDTVKEGFQETTFIEQIVEDESQMEGLPLDCSRIVNWHLHLEARELVYPKGWILQKNLDAVIPST